MWKYLRVTDHNQLNPQAGFTKPFDEKYRYSSKLMSHSSIFNFRTYSFLKEKLPQLIVNKTNGLMSDFFYSFIKLFREDKSMEVSLRQPTRKSELFNILCEIGL